jgi:probable rRNA maturation factor
VAVDLVVDDGVKIPAATLRALRTELGRMVRAAAKTDARDDYEVAARFVGDVQMRVLNRDYRGKDKPTDVLAFAHREGPAAKLHPDVLGDLVISVDTARKQAKQGLHAELLHLASHGLCHLLGYDHRDDDEEREMNARAAALRAEAKRRGRIRAA